ncbi:2-hydroxychromene-2-carboxylate isomerase [Massilia eurypsychrophila]|jgi:2-hydroxychromene-2-carboxylate isomerase|uniref:2-hydroxychromene-2-carboxylate isomerase n=1 Tax=Massilia eurypsychrophila TaxID=1485217 RepID=A0A2G8TK60_9BURK|nr:2-hydroxychromene-2-carboxylate isomerase [Massilia eurypsychrophila]PIL46426.1 2-hydroxychromene-2-carboxylate isomerase [Massilia eurypsychrophila]
MSKTIQYYLAPNSPWTYLGHQRFVDMAKAAGAHVELKPFDLAKVFGVSGGLPLAKRAPQRQAYRLAELARWSELLQVPLKPQPAFFPVPADAAAKLIIAARTSLGGDAALQVAGAVMRALWAEDKNISDEDALAQIATMCGFDGRMLVKSSQTAGVQEQYERNTDEAMAASVFGAPWYVVDGESFWGQDRLDFVERALAKA